MFLCRHCCSPIFTESSCLFVTLFRLPVAQARAGFASVQAAGEPWWGRLGDATSWHRSPPFRCTEPSLVGPPCCLHFLVSLVRAWAARGLDPCSSFIVTYLEQGSRGSGRPEARRSVLQWPCWAWWGSGISAAAPLKWHPRVHIARFDEASE